MGEAGEESREIAVASLRSVATGVRFGYDDAEIGELARSIGSVGLVVPLIVRPVAEGYEVVAGMRRLLAAKVVGLATVPCVVREMTDDEAVIVSLTENVNRREMNAVEEGVAYGRFLEVSGKPVGELARLLGRDVSYVSKRLALLDLDETTLGAVNVGDLTLHHALELRRCEDPSIRGYLREMTIKNGASVAVLHGWVDDYRREGDATPGVELGQGARAAGELSPVEQVECIVCGRTANQVMLQARFLCSGCFTQLQMAVAAKG